MFVILKTVRIVTNAGSLSPKQPEGGPNRSKFISTQQTFSYSFQTSTFASFTKTDGCAKHFERPSLEKILTSKPIIDWSFPDEAPNISQHRASHTGHTGQDPGWLALNTIREPSPPHRAPKVYSSWNNIDQFAKNHPRRNLPLGGGG